MNNKIRTFTDLIVWKEGHQLVLLIYNTTTKFPKEESFKTLVNKSNLTHQLLQGLITKTKSFISLKS